MTEGDYELLFLEFINKYEKSYNSVDVFQEKFQAFKTNYQEIEAHNKEDHSYSKAMNKFGDYWEQEFKAMFNSTYGPYETKPVSYKPLTSLKAPTVNWLTAGKVNPPRDQGRCNSGWAISAADAIATTYSIHSGDLYELSAQQFLDCASGPESFSCAGGYMNDAFEHAKVHGVCLE